MLKGGENVVVVQSCSASGAFIGPFLIFKRGSFQGNTEAGPEIAVVESHYISDDIFLQRLRHFQTHQSHDTCLLNLDGHSSL